MLIKNCIVQIGLWLSAGVLATGLQAATIQFQVTSLGGSAFRYNYFPSGVTLLANQQLDIRFDPALYGTLSNGVAGPGFSVLLFQPNNPPGTFGDYTALALVNNPSLAGPFSLDFLFKGAGTPGAQPALIQQFDQNGKFISTISSGTTTPFGSTSVPEPGSLSLGGLALLAGALWTVRRSSRDGAAAARVRT